MALGVSLASYFQYLGGRSNGRSLVASEARRQKRELKGSMSWTRRGALQLALCASSLSIFFSIINKIALNLFLY